MDYNSILAETHPTKYLIHKYWARKPHNVLRYYIKEYFSSEDLLVDPFCGSGVFLAEAKLQNVNTIGFDLNPIACLISEVTVNPPNIEQFQIEANKILDYIRDRYLQYYLVDNEIIRYNVFEVNTKCKDCGSIQSYSKVLKKGNRSICHNCNNKLSFNFETWYSTQLVKIIDRKNNIYSDPIMLKTQEDLSGQMFNYYESQELLVNRRILAFPKMLHSDLFTKRAFGILKDAFKKAFEIENEVTKKAVLLMLSSGVAQCSRLIPYRNNLTTGGPAWSVPGFWIAPVHLETNPIIHLQSRYYKTLEGLHTLSTEMKKSKATCIVSKTSAQKGLGSIDGEVDGIFFDPPYGDSVPYLEFSQLWTGFLSDAIEYKDEIVVSDRKQNVSSWEEYSRNIFIIISEFERVLKNKGKIIMTFNNLDPRAWEIVLETFEKFNFHCVDAKYQIPAVISSKAQFASNTSYIGDFYCVFEKDNEKYIHTNNDINILKEKLQYLFTIRCGKVPLNIVRRFIILTILRNNMNVDLIRKSEELLLSFAKKVGDFYISEIINNEKEIELLEDRIRRTASDVLKNGPMNVKAFYKSIFESTDDLGGTSIAEIKQCSKDIVNFGTKFCTLY